MSNRPAAIVARDVLQEYTDGRSYDPKAVKQITQQWVDTHMKSREAEFTKSTECSVFCGTWNVNAKKQEGGLHEWLLPAGSAPSDLYAVGFQEIVDLNAMNVAINSNNTSQRAGFWQERIREALDSTNARYELITEKYLVGLYLVIYASSSLRDRIRDVRCTSLGVGLMGMLGNKGGVSIRMSIFDSTVCFVCAHLAAHRENVAGRNMDFRNIYEKSVFDANPALMPVAPQVLASSGSVGNDLSLGAPTEKLTDSLTMPRQGAMRYLEQSLGIAEHEIVFWMGDLNYRIEDSITTEEVFDRIKTNNLSSLLPLDQLTIERAKGRVFQGFLEGVLAFAPTYKYQPGTDLYEQRAEKKLRAPAWCDRILYRGAVRLLRYDRANLCPSDHKPVYAAFTVTLKQVVESKERVVYQELVTGLNKYGSSKLPVVTVEGCKIAVQQIGFEEKYSTTITLRNTGDSIAHWRLVSKPEDSKVCKRWVRFSLSSGLLLPGESAALGVTLEVDVETARALNAGKDLLQDVVILRIEKSLDHHIEISANYTRSCYGIALEDLVSILTPVATTPLPAAMPEYYLVPTPSPSPSPASPMSQSTETTLPSQANKLLIPKELWRIVDALWTSKALKEKDLFSSFPQQTDAPDADPSAATALQQIRSALDHGIDFPAGLSPHAYAAALLSFLQALPRPLLPSELYPAAEVEDRQLTAFCRQLLEELPAVHYNVLVYVLSFFRELLVEEVAAYNRCTPGLLADLCLTAMCSSAQPPASAGGAAVAGSGVAFMHKVILHLLTATTL